MDVSIKSCNNLTYFVTLRIKTTPYLDCYRLYIEIFYTLYAFTCRQRLGISNDRIVFHV